MAYYHNFVYFCFKQCMVIWTASQLFTFGRQIMIIFIIAGHYQLIYVGESKIIRTVGTYFAVGCTAGWAWQDTHGLLLSYHCGAGVTLIVHFCHEFCAINMDTPNFICTKEEQRAVIHFCGLKLYQVSKCIEWCQSSMGTVSCHNRLLMEREVQKWSHKR